MSGASPPWQFAAAHRRRFADHRDARESDAPGQLVEYFRAGKEPEEVAGYPGVLWSFRCARSSRAISSGTPNNEELVAPDCDAARAGRRG